MSFEKLDLSHMTKQQVFDKVVLGLASQGWKRAMDAYGHHCAYKTFEGLRCAAGHLIPDGHPIQRESGGWLDVVSRKLANTSHLTLICELQTIHDGSTSPADMRGRFEIFAFRQGFGWPLLESQGSRS